ncbi:MAG: hypothetical protein GY725_12690 [bacterium]|nr:hypothetical protein [bacterium]
MRESAFMHIGTPEAGAQGSRVTVPAGGGRNSLNPRIIRALWTGSFAIWSLLAVPLSAEVPEQLNPDAACASAACHGFIEQAPHRHWAEFSGPEACRECHSSDDPRKHVFETDDSEESCFGCHSELGERMGAAKTVHEAAEDGGCLDCHDPHAGETAALLNDDVKDDNLQDLCFGCHDEDIVEGEYKHGPVDAGACTQCHDPHASSRAKLLRHKGMALCESCHEEIADLVKSSEHVHDPARDDCIDCHNPHSSNHPVMLIAEKQKICAECHADIVNGANNASVDHAPVKTRDECLSCHSPHASDHAAVLTKPERDLCLGCHDKRVESGDDVLTNILRRLEEHSAWHEPIRKDGCTACHDPHGNGEFRLLKKRFPERFYSPFRVRNYGLCFSCHESNLVTSRRTRSATAFRDGDRNLHFVHVNKKQRGRTCRACHDLHAGDGEAMISETIQFGGWQMPLHYESTSNGGSCQPGCHEAEAYERSKEKSVNSDALPGTVR